MLQQKYLSELRCEHVTSTLPAAAHNCLYINRAAIAANYRLLADKCPLAHCGAVVKADAYGLGAIEAVITLAAEGCRAFFVAFLDEGIAIRNALQALSHKDHLAIYVLNGFLPGIEREFLNHDLIPVLTDLGQVERWRKLAHNLRLELPVVLHVDTGMKRGGLLFEDILSLRQDSASLVGLTVKLIMSHLACAYEKENEFNEEQRQLFLKARNLLPLAPASFANSGGIFLDPIYHFNIVRPGSALYGLNPLGKSGINPMNPVIGVWARIDSIQATKPGDSVGYRRTYVSTKASQIATVTLGYADGLPFALSNQGSAWIGGYKVPIVGRISMDLVTIDVSSIPASLAFAGQWVEFLGTSSDIKSENSWANISQMADPAVLTALGKRLRRVYG